MRLNVKGKSTGGLQCGIEPRVKSTSQPFIERALIVNDKLSRAVGFSGSIKSENSAAGRRFFLDAPNEFVAAETSCQILVLRFQPQRSANSGRLQLKGVHSSIGL